MKNLKFGSALPSRLAVNLPNSRLTKKMNNCSIFTIKSMRKIIIILIIMLSHSTFGQITGKYISNPDSSSLTIFILRKNHTFKFSAKGQVAETIKQTGKWEVENDTLFFYYINQPIARIGLFEMPIKWTISENKTCGIPKLKPDYHECLMKNW